MPLQRPEILDKTVLFGQETDRWRAGTITRKLKDVNFYKSINSFLSRKPEEFTLRRMATAKFSSA
jgi:hypothetical protein